jgi:uncharacterized protein (DUF427 family)
MADGRVRRVLPLPGQESVWDYPRPPRLEQSDKRVRVIFNGITLAETTRALRVLETSHPPVYYLPPTDIQMAYLTRTPPVTYCEFKGEAGYYTIRVGDKEVQEAAWFYPNPTRGYEALRDYVAFYPGRMDACYLNEEQVRPQGGGFYGGWITSDVVGPFKGDPGTNSRFW